MALPKLPDARKCSGGKALLIGGYSLVVEPQPSKLMMRVRFPLPAPYKDAAHIAQSVEHFLGKEEVTGSNPVMSSIFRKYLASK
jgi:hypothetical protein